MASALATANELSRLGCARPLARSLAAAVGAHHGDFATTEQLLCIEDDPGGTLGRQALWAELRQRIVAALVEVICDGTLAACPTLPSHRAQRHALTVDLAGLTTVADWLGSNVEFFPYVHPPRSAQQYWLQAQNQAHAALREVGFRAPPTPPARSFQQLFGRSPWPLHAAVEGIGKELLPGTLVIVEAPTGEGKTEAALSIYDMLASRAAQGLYFALPTQATANQVLGRVERYLKSSFQSETHGLHLVHGGAGLSTQYEKLKARAFRTRSVGGRASSVDEQGPVADAWFARSKRALLAPLGVGTVDQALMGVLRCRHHFLRLHGLTLKVFVVDEVHAYETFTAELLARLCCWLRSLGTVVVLLSATLSSPQRSRLLNAYGLTSPPAFSLMSSAMAATRDSARPLWSFQMSWAARLKLRSELTSSSRRSHSHGQSSAVSTSQVKTRAVSRTISSSFCASVLVL